jgi:hypothetical protein
VPTDTLVYLMRKLTCSHFVGLPGAVANNLPLPNTAANSPAVPVFAVPSASVVKEGGGECSRECGRPQLH